MGKGPMLTRPQMPVVLLLRINSMGTLSSSTITTLRQSHHSAGNSVTIRVPHRARDIGCYAKWEEQKSTFIALEESKYGNSLKPSTVPSGWLLKEHHPPAHSTRPQEEKGQEVWTADNILASQPQLQRVPPKMWKFSDQSDPSRPRGASIPQWMWLCVSTEESVLGGLGWDSTT
ncbi:hypothetical protein MHYP_G00057890 [Metynnis hypsauchen]